MGQLRWRWEFEWKLQAWKVLAFLCALLSALVLWDQVQVPLPLDLSIFGVFIRAAGNSGGVTGATIMASLPLAYMCIAMYFAVFQFKSVNAIALHGSQNTNAYALLYNGAYTCRLFYSLAYNFLSTLYVEARSVKPIFSYTLGSMSEFVRKRMWSSARQLISPAPPKPPLQHSTLSRHFCSSALPLLFTFTSLSVWLVSS